MPHTVLIVEDEEMLLELLAGYIEMEGFNVLQAPDGNKALELFKEHSSEIGVVLSDMGLPGIGGWELFQEMKKVKNDVKVIFSSGFFEPSLREMLIKEGGVDFVQKPYVLKSVIEAIKKLCV